MEHRVHFKPATFLLDDTVIHKRREFFDCFFDTADRFLFRRHIVVRLRNEAYSSRKPEWTLRYISPFREIKGEKEIVEELATLLPATNTLASPIAYAQCAVLIYRFRRYYLSPVEWIDATYLMTDMVYTVGTRIVTMNDNLSLVPSKIRTCFPIFLQKQFYDIPDATMCTVLDPISLLPWEIFPLHDESDEDEDGNLPGPRWPPVWPGRPS